MSHHISDPAVIKIHTPSPSRTASERFLDGLLRLEGHVYPEGLLSEALQLLLEITGAEVVYLELFGTDRDSNFTAGHGITKANLGEIRGMVATSVVSSAVRDGQWVEAPCAASEHVYHAMCVPIADRRILGYVYLHGRAGTPPLDERTRVMVLVLARSVATVATRMLDPAKRTLHALTDDYKSRVVHETFERNALDTSATAEELGVDRKTIYRLRHKDA